MTTTSLVEADDVPVPRGPIDTRLLRLVPQLRWYLALCAVLAGAAAVVVLAQAELLGRTIPELVDDGVSADGVAALLVALAGIAAVRAGLAAVTSSGADRALDTIDRALRTRLLDHAEASTAPDSGGLAHRRAVLATAGPQELEPYVRAFLPALFLAVVVPIAAGLRIASLDLISAAIVAVTVPLIPIFMILIGRMTESRARRSWAMMQRLGGHFADVVDGLPTLRLFGRAEAQAGSVRSVADEYRRASASTMRIAMLSALALELLATLSVAIVAVAIGLRMVEGHVGLQVGLTVLLLAPECYLPIRRVGAAFHQSERGIDAVSDHLRTTSDAVIESGATTLAGPIATMSWSGLTVRPGPDVSPVAFADATVHRGTITAVTGPSGCGKTTLLRALRRRIPADTGAITVNGMVLDEVDTAAWATALVSVEQRPQPLWSTVRDEIAGPDGRPETAEQLARALGLEALLDERPDTLSGGELRRAHLAHGAGRIIDGSASILLVDEPTAQLDEASASAVIDLVDVLATDHGAIVVVATHDETLARRAHLRLPLAPVDDLPTTDREAGDAEVGLPRTGTRTATSVAERPTPPTLTDVRHALLRIAAMLRPSWRRFSSAIGLGVVAEGCTIGLAAVSAWLIVRASELPDLAVLAAAVTGVRAFGLGKGVFRYVERLAVHDAALDGLGHVRAEVIDHLATVDPLAVQDGAGLARRVVRDVDALLDLVARAVHPLAVSMIAAGLGAAGVGLIDWRTGLVLLALVTVFVVVLPLAASAHQLRSRVERAAAETALLDTTLHYTMNLDAVIGRGEARHHREVIDRAAVRHRDSSLRLRVGRTMVEAVTAAAPTLGATAALAVLAASGATLTGPVLAVAILTPLALLELAGSGPAIATHLVDGGTAAAGVADVLALPGEAPRTVDEPTPAEIDPPSLLVRDLHARRSADAPEVGPLSMQLRPGAREVIVGASGSGKSTVAAALVGYSPHRARRFEVNGRSEEAVGGAELRSDVVWIDQQPWLADTSVAANLRIAAPHATDADLVDALTTVGLGDWLDAADDGLETQVGRFGSRLSGGQAHRLGLARALLSSHDVAVLDEPTSHLDVATAATVMANLDTAFGPERSAVFLAHDRDTVDAVDIDGVHTLVAG